ncbi:hypothetical protein CUZ56_00325 [Saezia sanguinis]|uniref:Uncharacterized protein n=1 Tax=Saezia sanguinis TaxID=1965230 RepID=A0A433SGI5_9BURK|nr:hypothetical protein CUZ56_00325 [Saezia sanguinis]
MKFYIYNNLKIEIKIVSYNFRGYDCVWLYPLSVWSINDLDHNYTSRALLSAYQHLGMVQVVTDGNGEITWKAQSEVFGKTLPNNQNQIIMNLKCLRQYYSVELMKERQGDKLLFWFWNKIR